MLSLLPVLVAAVVGPVPPRPFSLVLWDLAALTDAEARQLAGRRALFRVVLDGEPDGDPEHGWRYECRGEGSPLRTLRLRDGDDLAAEVALQGSGGAAGRGRVAARRPSCTGCTPGGRPARPGLRRWRPPPGRPAT